MERFKSISISLNDYVEGLRLIIDERKSETLFEVDDAIENGEARYQILEGCFYDYEFNNKAFHFSKNHIVQHHPRNKHIGVISPNIYVGTLTLPFFREDKEIGKVELEVQSEKSGYRDDYRDMLELITEKCTDLLMQANSPVSHHFETDYTKDNQTLYQKFSFIQSILSTDEFSQSIHRIVSSPVTQWEITDEKKNVSSVRRYKNRNIRELVSGRKRMQLPDNHYLQFYGLHSLPEKVTTVKKSDTVDTPENRFIKHALEVFLKFCFDINKVSVPDTKLHKESLILIRELESYLSHSVFKEINRPNTLKINSPVLQRKEGYREVLRVWLMFDLAAKLIWKGGDDVYRGGKKDIAVLYEYWLFFKLLDLFNSIFQIEPKDIEQLIEKTNDGLNLQIKQGKYTAMNGIYFSNKRNLNVRFNYNRSFGGNKKYPVSGSWTTTLRPDYTLSFWPVGITEDEAEKQELIVHLHFDAKYKVENNLRNFIEKKEKASYEEDLNKEKNENRQGIYKNADLLKMHAYKDAIRRTGGAYVLYPGDKSLKQKGFHEIIPGLGAFPVRPSKTDSGIGELKSFIFEVIDHFINRASQREKLAFRIYDIHKNENPNELKDIIPELSGTNRNLIPDDIFVLLGYSINKERFDWYIKNGMYNFRMDDDEGSLVLDREVTEARFLLLRQSGKETTDKIFEIISDGPKVYSKEKLLKLGYPHPSKSHYLVIKIKELDKSQFGNAEWEFTKLEKFQTIKEKVKNPYKSPGIPFTVSLTELMKVKIKQNEK